MMDEKLERRDMELEDKRSRFLLNQSKLDTEHKMVYEDFLSPSKYPSAPPPPQTPPQSPLRPKKLEDELKSPGDSVKKKMKDSKKLWELKKKQSLIKKHLIRSLKMKDLYFNSLVRHHHHHRRLRQMLLNVENPPEKLEPVR